MIIQQSTIQDLVATTSWNLLCVADAFNFLVGQFLVCLYMTGVTICFNEKLKLNQIILQM